MAPMQTVWCDAAATSWKEIVEERKRVQKGGKEGRKSGEGKGEEEKEIER